jgi:hypothetical protein
MIFYLWVAVSESNRTPPGQTDPAQTDPGQTDMAESGPPVAMGITDDRARAIKAGEETLGSGRAAMVIIEVVRPGMAARTLAPCYVRTGVGWLGRRTPAGGVAWDRFFV